MKDMKQFWLFSIVLVVFMAGSMLMYNSLLGKMDGGFTKEDLHTTVPDFTVYDELGMSYDLSEFFGQPIILNFWSSWCGPCRAEMPLFQSAYEAHGEEIKFLMINSTDGKKETVATAQEFLDKNGYTFPVLFDTSGDAVTTYGVYGLPMTLFISADGSLLGYVQGPLKEDLMQQGIALFSK